MRQMNISTRAQVTREEREQKATGGVSIIRFSNKKRKEVVYRCKWCRVRLASTARLQTARAVLRQEPHLMGATPINSPSCVSVGGSQR